MANSKKGSAFNIIEMIVIAVLIILIGAMLFMYFTFSKDGAAPSVFGYTIYHTKAVNMVPQIPANTVVFGKTSKLDEIITGSVVICKIGEDTVLTRVVEIINDNGDMSYVVKFDRAPDNDTFRIPAENVIARASMQSSIFGSLLSFATSTLGIMLVIIIPSFIIIVFQVVRIMNVKHAEEGSPVYTEDEIKISSTEIEDFFSEPASFTTGDPEPEPEPKVQEKSVLSVDKNGKAGLTAVRDEGTPLFSYEGFASGRSSAAKAEGEQEEFSFRSVTSIGGDNSAEADSAYSEDNTEIYDEEPAEEESSGTTDFMSTILPEGIAAAAAKAESPLTETESEPAKVYEPKSIPLDKVVRQTNNIPEQAVVPVEKLAPPRKKNNSKAISELMSIIDAEESKLKK